VGPERSIGVTRSGRLSGKVAIVSGGASGIGLAIATAFVREGASVVVGDLKEPKRAKVDPEHGFLRVALDVRDRASWRSVANLCAKRYGAADVLVSNAGVMESGLIADSDGTEWQHSFEVNVLGSVFGIQAVLPGMTSKGHGSVIITSSVASMMGAAAFSAYAATKAANMSLARSAALELGPAGIRVNSLHPGGIETPMSQGPAFEGFDQAAFYKKFPIPRIGQPEEIAHMAVFLASDESSFATGAAFVVDGGQLAGTVL
jgi:3alpha(or 20beta)-hydroxysteroid dehydrogenase